MPVNMVRFGSTMERGGQTVRFTGTDTFPKSNTITRNNWGTKGWLTRSLTEDEFYMTYSRMHNGKLKGFHMDKPFTMSLADRQKLVIARAKRILTAFNEPHWSKEKIDEFHAKGSTSYDEKEWYTKLVGQGHVKWMEGPHLYNEPERRIKFWNGFLDRLKWKTRAELESIGSKDAVNQMLKEGLLEVHKRYDPASYLAECCLTCFVTMHDYLAKIKAWENPQLTMRLNLEALTVKLPHPVPYDEE